MSLLDNNIKNNLFRKAATIGANVLSGKITQEIKGKLFDKIGENNLISVRGFLGSHTAALIRRLLFTREGASGHFDPVWKLASYHIPDANTGEMGSIDKTVADDFAGAGAPKYKFMYTVSFEYRDDMLNLLSGNPTGSVNQSTGGTSTNLEGIEEVVTTASRIRGAVGSDYLGEVSFALKTASRPSPIVTFQDVNFYNFRTKVGTKVDYGNMTLTFYDDIRNTAHKIYELYLKTISPIANISNTTDSNRFSKLGVSPEDGDPNVSSIGPLSDEGKNGLIRAITITHHLPLNYQQDRTNNPIYTEGSKITSEVVQYIFMNPKIQNFMLDDLDMTANDVSTVALTFTYDSVYISNAPLDYTFGSELDVLQEIVPTAQRINQTGILDRAVATVQEKVEVLNNNTLLKKVKNFINLGP